ncbi:patatin-like phospholipase family protein [Desmonostoc muscorum CCALA 125]|nr:patatin-like phospholipase family protein [Desmonostoc muscorum CCALA 125]
MSNIQTDKISHHAESEEKVFKVLSIDGGGIKGLYSAMILERFEKKFQCHLADHFDLICGTSTGGLIALALSLKVEASKIAQLYYSQGEKIFKKQGRLEAFFRQFIYGGKHQNEELEKALRDIFRDKTISESYCLLCIPAFSLTDGRPFIFKYDHPEGNLSRDNETKYIDVALATSAAPTYLPVVQIQEQHNKQFIDGGVYANNPTLIGVVEALNYFVGSNKKFSRLMVMSISSLAVSTGKPLLLKRNRALIDWKQDLISPFAEGQSYLVDYMVKTLAQNSILSFEYVRIPSIGLSPEQSLIITLDNTTKDVLDLIKGFGDDQGLFYEKKAEVEKFFQQQKQYIIRS